MKYFKLKFLLLFAALAMAIPPAWAETVTVTLTQSILGLTGSYTTNTEKTVEGITYVYTDLMKNNENIQAKASSGVIYNKSAYPGNITSVVITHSGTARSTTISGSSNGTDWTQVATGSGSITGDFSGKGYKHFKITRGSNAAYWTKIEITYETGGGDEPESVAKPTFSPAGGTYTSAQSVELSCATDGATIYYTTDGTTPDENSTSYDGAIEVNETMTIKAIAMKEGLANSDVAEATYTINLPKVVTNLTAANALDPGDVFTFNGSVVVTYVNGTDIYVRDVQNRAGSTTAGYLFRASNAFANGDKLKAGWQAEKDVFNGLDEFKNVSGLKKDGTADASPEVITGINPETDINKYVKFEGVTKIVDNQGNPVTLYDKFGKNFSFEQGKVYNVTGIVGYYNGLQFNPTDFEEVSAPVADLEITLDPEVASATVDEVIEVTVTANTDAEVIYEYSCDPVTATLTETATGFTITNATAGDVIVTVTALDDDGREATTVGTYTFEDATEPSGYVIYQKVTKTSDITDGRYMIVNGAVAFNSSLDPLDVANNILPAHIDEDEGVIIVYVDEFYFTYDSENKTLMGCNGLYIGQTSDANGLETSADTRYANNITINEDGNADIVSGGAYLRYNSASNQNRFRYYKSSSYTGQKPVTLYKAITGTPEPLQVATPTFDPAQGEYTEAQNVTIDCETEGATIHYTTDGTEPTAESPVYSEPIAVGETMTIKAIAMKSNMTDSEVASATYTINIPSGDGNIYVKVTNPSQFAAGKKYIVVNEENNIAMGAYASDYCAAVSVDIVDGTIDISNTGVVPLKLEEASTKTIYYGGSNKTVTTYSAQLQDGSDMYLGWNSGTKLKTINRATDNYFWYFGPDLTSEKGNILYLAEANTRSLAQGSSNTGVLRFGAYTSENSVLYVEKPSGEPVVEPVDPEMSFGETTAFTVYPEADFTAPTLTTVPEGLTVTYSSSDEDVAMVDPATGEVLIGEKIGTATITASFAGNENYNATTATYTITVEARPELATEDKVEFETTVGTPVEKTITVMGENLKGDITLTLTDETGMFSINRATIAMADMTDEGVEVTVTYAPTAEDIHEATITVASKDAKSVTVSLIGMATEPEQVATPKFKNPTGTYTDEVMIDITCETEGATIYFKFNETDPEWYEYNGPMMWRKTTPVYAMATKAGMRDSEVATVTYTIVPAEPVATPTFSLVAGSYTGEQTLNINCETQGATISYSTDGGQNWTVGNTVTLTEDCTVMAKAVMDGMTESAVASATYIIDIPAVPAQIPAIDGYFSITNNETGKYVNVAGRKTITFTDAPDAMAGTVIRVKTNDNGQVQVLRSQAADLQGYANRAMRYVPEIVDMVVNKLNAEGDGQILGNEGLDAIMAKFNECFDYHLYIEEANGGYRLYGKTPSMQPVVEFYRENKAKVDAKLPMLEDFINDAITKLLAKTNGSGASILKPFSVHQTWERMGGTLTEPVDEASTLQFYQEVLNNKNYVWDFAYETAMTYWERLKDHDKYDELKDKLGEFAQYIEKLENVRPDFKYYVVQNGGKIDYISEGNKAITDNAASTIWTLNERATFKVNIPEANKLNTNKYAATLYTDFAYDLPEGVTAYKVTSVTTLGDAVTEAITGTVPAQTPVLLQATTAGEKTLTLNLNDGTAPADNLLVGADYFIKEYEVKTPQLVTLFSYAKDLLGESFYENNIAQYEHLMLKTAGTVNNKYMWGLTSDDLNYCVAINDNGEEDCVVRNLSNGDKGLGFYKNWTAPANQAFLSSDKFNPIRLNLRGDIDRNGVVSISDVSALIDILLALPERPYDPQYDYIAADFNEDGVIKISDVSALIDYLLNMGVNTHIEGD